MALTAAVVKIPQKLNELEEIKQNEDLTDKERGKAKGGAIGDATGSIAGAAVGGAAGIAAGAAAGAVAGSVVPILGTAVGALVGAGIGALGMYLGGKAGRKIGEGIGESLVDDGSEQPQKKRYNGTMLGGIDIPRKGQAGPTQQQANGMENPTWQLAGGMEMPSRQQVSQVRIPESVLPPQILRNETPIAPPAKAEVEGQVSMDVNVNLSGERPKAQVSFNNSNVPWMKFNAGNAGYARQTAS
jgi:hypothetical protein